MVEHVFNTGTECFYCELDDRGDGLRSSPEGEVSSFSKKLKQKLSYFEDQGQAGKPTAPVLIFLSDQITSQRGLETRLVRRGSPYLPDFHPG